MGDKNKNGIPDDKEKPKKPKTSSGLKQATVMNDPLYSWLGNGNYTGKERYKPSTKYTGLFGNIANFANDTTRNLNNWWQSDILGEVKPLGGGHGDAIVGSNPASKLTNPKRSGNGGNPGLIFDLKKPQPVEEERERTLADYLAMASELIGGDAQVNYDPQRNTLRQRAAEGDSRLEAMYRQLRGSIDADAPVLQKAYQDAIGNTAQISQNAQDQAQAATNSANAQNQQVLANLGIQQAAGNIVQNGTDLNTQTAQKIGDMATRGQAAGTRLASNQATALTHNTNVGNAAGLEGNLQRAANQSKLQALLADIDMKEQQDNAAASQSSFSTKWGVVQDLLGFDRYNQDREDQLQMSAAELAAKNQQQKALPNFTEIMEGMAKAGLKLNPDDLEQFMKVMDSGRKFSY